MFKENIAQKDKFIEEKSAIPVQSDASRQKYALRPI
jgi:hypothetical protein